MLKLLRRLLLLGLLAWIVHALWKRFGADAGSAPVAAFSPVQDRPVMRAAPPVAAVALVADASPSAAGWVEPEAGACPVSHPVKGKRSSGIFHLPGGQNYERTRADRCYVDAAAAEADGLRRAKR